MVKAKVVVACAWVYWS